MGLDVDEFYSMTLGNYLRKSLGHVKNQWIVNRELLAAILSHGSKKRIKGNDIISFNVTKEPNKPTEQDRENMRKRHEDILKHG